MLWHFKFTDIVIKVYTLESFAVQVGIGVAIKTTHNTSGLTVEWVIDMNLILKHIHVGITRFIEKKQIRSYRRPLLYKQTFIICPIQLQLTNFLLGLRQALLQQLSQETSKDHQDAQ